MNTWKFKTIEFNTQNSKYVIDSYSLNDGNTRYQEYENINFDGSSIYNIHYNTRVVIISGHIVGDNEADLIEAKQELFRICNAKSKDKLFYSNGYSEYFIDAIANLPTLGKQNGYAIPFSLAFDCYNFYWYEKELTSVPVISRQDLVTTSFTLPCVFTSRINEGNIYNNNLFEEYPLIKIYGGADGGVNNIVITNNSTTQVIEFNYTISAEEIITIDCANVKVYNDKGENLINYISDDFAEFVLAIGNNYVTATCDVGQTQVAVNFEYHKKLIGV